jgi:phosphohistidine phosphatase SixA
MFPWPSLMVVATALALVACQAAPQTVVVTPRPAATTAPPAATNPTSAPMAGSAAPPPAAAPAQPTASAQSQPTCAFGQGFATMRDLVGAAIVGDCREDERQIPGNGNAEQRTANGTLVYRALDGRLLFTNDSRTWINGPDGLVDRPNNQRFPWEGDRQVIEALQRGGYLVYFRHGATDSSQTDSDPNNLANCATQRNLTDQGRAQARAIGEAWRALNIPTNKVLTSEYCRAKEYAQLTIDAGELEPSLVLPDPLPPEVRQANTAAFQRLLAIPPPSGTNVVFVAHSPNIRDAVGVDLPVEGQAAVLQPNPGEAPTLVARILPDEWTPLAQALGNR